jgi:outer membrane protein OmpA-like peptidoglycan-associated protein
MVLSVLFCGVVGGVAGGVIVIKWTNASDKLMKFLQKKRVGEGIQLVLNENAVRFDTNKSSLTTTAKANLDKLVPVFAEYPDTDITILIYR